MPLPCVREGKAIAIALNDGTQVFKRVGEALPGSMGNVRQFESMGGLGKSMRIATEQVEDGRDEFPLIGCQREIPGRVRHSVYGQRDPASGQ